MIKNACKNFDDLRLMVACAVAAASVIALAPAEAKAWEFESCSSTLTTEIDLRTPQAMIMLDRSGSMTNKLETPPLNPNHLWGWVLPVDGSWPLNDRSHLTLNTSANWADRYPAPYNSSSLEPDTGQLWSAEFNNQLQWVEPSYGFYGSIAGYGTRYWRTFWFDYPGSLWDIAVRELKAALQSYDTPQGPKIKFGLGTYTNWYTSDVVINYPGWGIIWREASEYTNSHDYMEFFRHPQQGGPTIGATPTQQAIDVMRTSATMSNTNTANTGILITDGVPNMWVANGIPYADHDSIEPYGAAVEAACRHREVAPMYVIGFSDLADPDFNDLVAAAGGTGTCVDDQNQDVDPCASSYSGVELVQRQRANKLSCTGGFQADTGNEFKQALDSITSQIACTYPLDVLNTPNQQAPEDPEGSRVFLGECEPGAATHTAMGSEFTEHSSGGPVRVSRTELNLPCSGECGAVMSQGNELVYDLPTTPGEEHTARIRLADYLHNCSDAIKVEVRMDSTTVIGTWTGNGANDWAEIEFPFTPTHDRTFISIVQLNDAYCMGNNSCDPNCSPLSGDLNLYVDWVKVKDPGAGCSGNGALSYQPPGSNARGWTFNEHRTQVTLTGSACTEVQAKQFDRVVTQVACPCEHAAGSLCNTESGATCPVGFWECTAEWEDICVPDEECEIGECAPVTHHDTAQRRPNVQMVVDNSGSMDWRIRDNTKGNKIEGDVDESRHNIARRVIGKLAEWSYKGAGCQEDGKNCDRLRMGIHFWSTAKKKKYSAQEDMTQALVHSAFTNNPPSGGTDFHLAAELLNDENALKDVNAANIGVMVTDGEPSSLSTLQTNLTTTCNIRKRAVAPIPTYVLGFGVANADDVNSLVAAAGGTGKCCEGAGCAVDDPAAVMLDPCDLTAAQRNKLAKGAYNNNYNSYYGKPVTCTGNISAETDAALQNRLMELFQSFECVFPLTLLPDMESASTNPIGTRVHIYLKNAGDLVKVPHIDDIDGQAQFVAQLAAKGVANADEFIDDGWSFANEGRTAVRLSDNVCDQIQDQAVTRVDTQVCKVCENVGKACDVPCQPGDEHCGEDGFLMGRCGVGEYICVYGEEYCVQTRNPMPEICNGIDDDCNGVVDDLADSTATWTGAEWDFGQYNDADYTALACYGNNVCTCANNESDPMFGEADDDDELYQHLSGQRGIQVERTANCYCGEGLADAANRSTLSPSSSAGASADEPQADGGAMCSMSGSSRSSALDAWWFVGVLGLFGAGRMRRRSRKIS